eukprot:EG_transcript_43201
MRLPQGPSLCLLLGGALLFCLAGLAATVPPSAQHSTSAPPRLTIRTTAPRLPPRASRVVASIFHEDGRAPTGTSLQSGGADEDVSEPRLTRSLVAALVAASLAIWFVISFGPTAVQLGDGEEGTGSSPTTAAMAFPLV